MKGLDLCREFWFACGLPTFRENCPEVLEHAAIGLVGEGSDCFGFDDEISRDHDWGPGFCVWLTEDAMARFGEKVQQVYASLPDEYLGFRRLRVSEQTANRVGIQEIGEFYYRYTGLMTPPECIDDWRGIPEYALATVTNGEVFCDPIGVFSAFREKLLSYYPEDLRRKKLAAASALAGQSGQYNYYRCVQRGEKVAAMQALSEFTAQSEQILFLLNRKYSPYYKWTHHALRLLPILGVEIGVELEHLYDKPLDAGSRIERISSLLIHEICRQGLSDSKSDFILNHGETIQYSISDATLRWLPLMAE